MTTSKHLLRHLLAALAYRTQHALNDAPPDFGGFAAGGDVRTPHEVLHHMNGLLHLTIVGLRSEPRTRLEPADSFDAEIERLHELLATLSALFAAEDTLESAVVLRLLQGPLADALTHTGQLALLRRLAGFPVTGENFYRAAIDTENVGRDQPLTTVVDTRPAPPAA
ncbi:MAG: hypothetical protein WD766_03410 [Gemmatimonadota bacterium]